MHTKRCALFEKSIFEKIFFRLFQVYCLIINGEEELCIWVFFHAKLDTIKTRRLPATLVLKILYRGSRNFPRGEGGGFSKKN